MFSAHNAYSEAARDAPGSGHRCRDLCAPAERADLEMLASRAAAAANARGTGLAIRDRMNRSKYLIWLFTLPLLWSGCAADPALSGDGGGGGNVGFGGAQDIGQFRGIIEQGGIPGESTLDANGFFNEHFTELPAADCGNNVCLQSMLSVGRAWLDNSYQATLQIAMNSPLDPADAVRKPLNLVVVVDRSGSMTQGDRIGFAREGLHLLIDALQEDDRLALVSYSDQITVLNDLNDPLDRETMHAMVDSIQAGGSTDFHGGLREGFEVALGALDFERQNRVIMVSDGLPTAGVTDDDSIILMSTDYIGSGIGLTTVGVGTDFNVELMRGLAERGAGNFYFLENAAAIQEVFTEELDYFVEPIALGLNLQVQAADSYDLGEVVGTRLWRTEGSGGSMFVPAAFLASRTSNEPDQGRRGGGSAIIIPLDPRSGAIGSEVATVTLRYRLPITDEVVEQTIVVENPNAPGEAPEDNYYSHAAVAENYAMYNMYLGLRDATRASVDNYHCALSVLTRLVDAAAAWNLDYFDEDIDADIELASMFMANLRAVGALDPDELGGDACEDGSLYDYPIDDFNDGPEVAEYDYGLYGCQASGGASGSTGMLVLIGLALAVRRRRRS